MFKNKKFVFIGKFKKDDLILNKKKISKKTLIDKIIDEGGKNVTGISNKTDYIIFPNKITSRERSNKQIDNLKKIYNSNIQFLNYKWILKSLEKKKKISFESYKIKEFYKLLPKLEVQNFVFSNKNSFYKNFLSEKTKCWKEFVDNEGNLYYYNILTGLTTYKPPKDYLERLFGNISIEIDKYFTEESVIKMKEDVELTINNFEKSLKLLQNYEKNLKDSIKIEKKNRKRKRKEIIKNEFENFLKKIKK